MNKYKLGIIGAGNMSTAIWKGIISSAVLANSQIIVSDVTEDKLGEVRQYGLAATTDNGEVISNSEYVLFAIKPQCFAEVAAAVKGKLNESKVISIMAGISVATIKNSLEAKKVCRVMPNTPCMVGMGMSAICFAGYAAQDKSLVSAIFSSLGDVLEVTEDKMDAVTSVSGSGPAYVYMFIDAMIKGGMKGGLSYQDAKRLTLATMRGGAQMVEKNPDKEISQLIDAVCSKGGTTIQAVNYYQIHNLTDIIVGGVDACRARSIEMSGGCTSKPVTIYTDGACSGNPGPGGWAGIMICDGTEKVMSGGESNTTNNRMELTAVIECLSALNRRCVVEVYSDSSYVVNAVSKGWIYGWKAKNWGEVKNVDLWKKLLMLLSAHDVRFIKVKGHSDNEMNNRCDVIARNEAKKVEEK